MRNGSVPCAYRRTRTYIHTSKYFYSSIRMLPPDLSCPYFLVRPSLSVLPCPHFLVRTSCPYFLVRASCPHFLSPPVLPFLFSYFLTFVFFSTTLSPHFLDEWGSSAASPWLLHPAHSEQVDCSSYPDILRFLSYTLSPSSLSTDISNNFLAFSFFLFPITFFARRPLSQLIAASMFIILLFFFLLLLSVILRLHFFFILQLHFSAPLFFHLSLLCWLKAAQVCVDCWTP